MIATKSGILVGFSDYSAVQYDLLMRYLGEDTRMSLCEKVELLFLYLNPPAARVKILIWHEDVSQRGLLFASYYERGCDVLLAKSLSDFIKHAPGYQYATCYTRIGGTGRRIASYISGSSIVYSLSAFIDGSIREGFDKVYYDNLLAIGFRLFYFEVSGVVGFNVHAVRFLARLAVAAAEYGALFAFLGLQEGVLRTHMRRDLEDADYMFYPTIEAAANDPIVAEVGQESGAAIRRRAKGLSKESVAQLPLFVQATIETLEMMTGIHAKKEGVALTQIDFRAYSGEFMAASIGFYGQLEEMMALLFPVALAKQACQLFLQDESVQNDDIADTLGELINIIIGKSKVALAACKVAITVTIPRTFRSLKELAPMLAGKKGAKIDFSFDDRPFHFILTR